MLLTSRSLCPIRLISNRLVRHLPRPATSSENAKPSDYAVIDSSPKGHSPIFNDYNVIKAAKPALQSRPVPKSVPKVIDVQTGLTHFIKECDARTLLMTIETKHKVFDSNTTATFIERLYDLKIMRDSDEKQHQRMYDFVDYFGEYRHSSLDHLLRSSSSSVLKHGQQFDFEHVLTAYFQLASLNGTAPLSSRSGNYALKALVQLLKHNVNKYHLHDIGRLLLSLEQDLHCNPKDDERLKSLFDALLLLTKFRQNELDRLDARSLAELAYVFASELDHVYFTNLLTEYNRDEYYHDKHSTMLMLRALDRRGYKHNRTLDICLHFVHENKELFGEEEMDEVKRCLNKLEYQVSEE